MKKGEKKEDGRVIYTKMRIQTAFYELLNEYDYEKITVTLLCKEADINRATFYKHYLDIDDLVDKLQEKTIAALSKKMRNTPRDELDNLIIDILKFYKKTIQEQMDPQKLPAKATANYTSKITRLIYDNFSEYTVSTKDKTLN
ncbi:MAG: TetR/AcrR family transcriptional regulator, partial [Lachnospiraceae bacterium]|nr:TetR/AcrR family transcriptional regulator [Lachnospiraceae bacterium]